MVFSGLGRHIGRDQGGSGEVTDEETDDGWRMCHVIDSSLFLETRSRHLESPKALRAHDRLDCGRDLRARGAAGVPRAMGDPADGTITTGTPVAGSVTEVKTSVAGSRITLRLDQPVKTGIITSGFRPRGRQSN